jgi:hypothetical protein
MAQLFSDLVDGSGRRYFFNLKSAPGGVSVNPGQLTLQGLAPSVLNVIQIFRTPAIATLTLQGLSLSGTPRPSPATAQLGLVGQIPFIERIRIVTNALPTPDYSPQNDLAPQIVFVNTVTPGIGQLNLQGFLPNASPGGDIGYITPGLGQLTVEGLAPTLIFLEVGLGLLTLEGQAPELLSQLIVTPDVGALIVNGFDVEFESPFQWTDVESPPSMVWTTAALNS